MGRFHILAFILLFAVGCENDISIIDDGVPNVWVDSFQQPYEMNGMDILWVIDKSCSMVDNADQVVDGIGQMMDALPESGWRLGITSMSTGESLTNDMFPLVPGDTTEEAWDRYTSLEGIGERGFSSAYLYLSVNEYTPSWLRADAGLLVVFVSDEDDFSADFETGIEFAQWFSSIRQNVFITSIVTHEPETSACPLANYPHDVGEKYLSATQALNGVAIDICEEDWSPGVSAALDMTAPLEEIALTYKANPDTVRVFVDQEQYGEWVYIPEDNRVVFTTLPPGGSFVEVVYALEE